MKQVYSDTLAVMLYSSLWLLFLAWISHAQICACLQNMPSISISAVFKVAYYSLFTKLENQEYDVGNAYKQASTTSLPTYTWTHTKLFLSLLYTLFISWALFKFYCSTSFLLCSCSQFSWLDKSSSISLLVSSRCNAEIIVLVVVAFNNVQKYFHTLIVHTGPVCKPLLDPWLGPWSEILIQTHTIHFKPPQLWILCSGDVLECLLFKLILVVCFWKFQHSNYINQPHEHKPVLFMIKGCLDLKTVIYSNTVKKHIQ